MKTIDTRGFPCPMPIVMVKKAINETSAEEQIKILSDSSTTFENLLSFINDNEINIISKDSKEGVIIITKSGNVAIKAPAEAYCKTEKGKAIDDITVVIKSLRMGEGDELIGKMLLESFINNLCEQDKLPKTMVFYNEGTKLLSDGSTVCKAIKKIEDAGVRIISCGTCIDFYEIRESVKTGVITNMHTITETIMQSSKVIYP